MKRFYLFCMVSMISFNLYSQYKAEIKVIHRVRNDSVIVRWAPTTAIAWNFGNRDGYRIFRHELNKVNDSLTSTKVLLVDLIKPLPLDDWEGLVTEDRYAPIAAQALYGDDFVVQEPGNDVVGFYNQITEIQNRFGFSLYAADMSLPVAQAMGLMYVDTSYDSTKEYVYRVVPLNENKEYSINSGVTIVKPSKPQIFPAPNEVNAAFGDKSVKISWNTYYDNGIYIAYVIERSDDGGKSYKRRSDVPYSPMDKNGKVRRTTYFLDSLEQNLKLYYYRVRGVNSFGEEGPPSAVVKGTGLASANGITTSFDTAYISNKGAYLKWYYPEHLKRNLLGYIVCNSSEAKGPFREISKLLLPHQDTYVDKFPETVNYYAIKAIGMDSIAVTSLPILLQPLDSIAPSIPVSLTGNIDSLGYVNIDWKPSPDADIAGYRVFKANSLSEEFVQITSGPVLLSQYTDKVFIETLTRDIYYKIVAVDHRDNMSGFSKPLKLQKPDVIPPAPPVFTNYATNDKGIFLEWENSISDDVKEHLLIRKTADKDTSIQILAPGVSSFNDKNIVEGVKYNYFIKAVDISGLSTLSEELNVQAFSSSIKSPIEDFKGKAEKEAKIIVLQWNYELPEVNKFVIYRSKNDEPMRFYKNVGSEMRNFTDRELNINNIYSYQIKAVFKNDDESLWSEAVKVRY